MPVAAPSLPVPTPVEHDESKLEHVRKRFGEAQVHLIVDLWDLWDPNVESAADEEMAAPGVWERCDPDPRSLNEEETVAWVERNASHGVLKRFYGAIDSLFMYPEAILQPDERAFLDAFALMVKERS